MSEEQRRQLATSAARVLDRAMDATILPGYSRLGPMVRKRLPGWPADPAPGALQGKDVIVTGASSGLGAATAARLAALGAHVHLVVRDTGKGQHVVREAQIAHTSTIHGCDLSDLDDVRRLADLLEMGGKRYAGIVHNAGAMPPKRTFTPQGHELSVALHVLAPVLLTDLLLPSLDHARVVLVTSGGMYTQRLRLDDLEYQKDGYAPATAYARSKRMQVELLSVLTSRWGGLGQTVSATHPGWADTPGVEQSLPVFRSVLKPLLRDAAEGADTAVWLVGADPAPPAGKLWQDRHARPITWFGVNASTDADRSELWEWVRVQLDLPPFPHV